MRRPTRAAAAVLAVLLAGCGSSAAPSRPAAGHPSVDGPVRVEIKDIEFVPRSITVKLGSVVRWTNRDRVAHTVASTRLRLSSDVIRGGGTFTYRPRRRGTFKYFCTIHADQNGVLIVR